MAKIFQNPRLVLLFILLFASFLRLWRLDTVPPGLFGDEVDVGYHAYSILQTGRDYMGQFLPVYVHSLAEWRAPLFIYSAVPTVAIFGLNEWGVRLPAAIFGTLGIFLIYLLGKKLYGERIGLIAAFLLSIVPLHLHYSRAAFEVTLLLDLVIAGTLFFLNARGTKGIVASAFLFALAPYTYSTAVVFMPLYVCLLVFLFRETVSKKDLTLFLLTIFVIVIPFVQMTVFGSASGRFSLLSVFGNDRIIDEINIERTETAGKFERFFHNKPIAWGEVIASNYVRSFSPEFLFVRGDPNPRHSVPGTGVFYWAYLPFLLFGIYKLFSIQTQAKTVIVGWLALAPLASSLTVDGANHATRLFLMIPPIILITAFGLVQFLEIKMQKRKLVLTLVCLFLFGNVAFYLHRYFVHYGLQMWRYWHYGYKETMQAVIENQDMYKLVFINNTYEPSLLHYLFYSKYSPVDFQATFTSDAPRESAYPGFTGFRFGDKTYFGQSDNLLEFLQPGMLYLAVQGKEIPGDWDWSKSPPADVKVLKHIKTLQDGLLFTLVAKE